MWSNAKLKHLYPQSGIKILVFPQKIILTGFASTPLFADIPEFLKMVLKTLEGDEAFNFKNEEGWFKGPVFTHVDDLTLAGE